MSISKRVFRILTGGLLAAALLVGLAVPLSGTVRAAEPTPYLVADDLDTRDYYTQYVLDTAEKQQGTGCLYWTVNAKSNATIQNLKSFGIPYGEVKDSYLELWLFVDKTGNLNQTKCRVGLYQSASLKSEIKLPGLTNGWNRLQIKVSDFNLPANFDTVNRIYFYFEAGTKAATLRLDDICFVAAKEAGDLSGLQAAIEMGEALNGTDLSAYDQANVDAFRAALAFAKTRLTGFSQRDVDVAAVNLKNAMNAFGMEGFEEDGKATYAFIDFDTMTYSRVDRVAILNANGEGGVETVAEKGAAAFSGKLQLAVSDEYIAAADGRVRIIVTYNNSAKTLLNVNYSAADGVKAAAALTLDDSNSWGRHSATLADARFTDGIEGKFDFELAPAAGTVYVTRVEVRRIDPSDITEQDPPAFAPMTEANDFHDKSVAGYQMWFTATGGWVHWAGGNVPSNDRISFEMWPDISEYPDNVMGQTNFKDLGDGRKAKLFTSVTPEVVDIHVSWMKDAGLDGFAIQRFFGDYNRGDERDYKNLVLARDAAEKYGRVFYVMYDMNGGLGRGQGAADVLKSDFVRNVENKGIVSSPAYAQMDGKPVVCMWGLDPGSDSYTNFDASMDFINWLHDRGYYVVGGTSNNTWYDGTNSFTDLYHSLDMISPWTVGRYSMNAVVGWMRNNVAPGLQVCEQYGIDFQPVVLAGGSWHNHNWGMPNDQPHLAGDFLWRQIYVLKNMHGCERVYFAMFDEYDEGTAIMKAAQDSYDIPEDEQYFLTLATDGTWLSSDFNLRLAGAICEIMRSDAEVPLKHTVPFSEGPIFWRNSFEQRWTYVREKPEDTRITVGVSLQSLDVGLPTWEKYGGTGVTVYDKAPETGNKNGHPYVDYVEGNDSYKQIGTSTEGTGLHCDPGKTRTSNGTWSLQFNGKAYSDADSLYLISGADTTNIMISAAGLELSYDILADNELGRYAYVDLILDVDGSAVRLSQYVKDVKTSGAQRGKWVTKTVTLPASLVGQRVIGVAVGYTHDQEGDFNAYLDNVLLQSPGTPRNMLRTALSTARSLKADDALTAALSAGAALQENASATDKQRLAAVKAIDAAIRNLDLSAGEVEKGDVDGDGKITSTDARLTLQLSVNKIGESDLKVPAAADVDGDGKVTSTDARLILQFSVGKITEWP